MGLAGPQSRVLAFGSRVPDFDVVAITDIVCFLASAINESDTKKRAIYVRDPTMWVLFDEKIVMSSPSDPEPSNFIGW